MTSTSAVMVSPRRTGWWNRLLSSGITPHGPARSSATTAFRSPEVTPLHNDAPERGIGGEVAFEWSGLRSPVRSANNSMTKRFHAVEHFW
jgi:hypothetical protein